MGNSYKGTGLFSHINDVCVRFLRKGHFLHLWKVTQNYTVNSFPFALGIRPFMKMTAGELIVAADGLLVCVYQGK